MFSTGSCAPFSLQIPGVRHDFKVLAFDGTERISSLYAIRVELVSERADIDLEGLLSQPAFLQFGFSNEGIHGRIEDVGVGETRQRLTHYELTLVPALHYLQFSQDQRIFQQQTVPQIIAQVLKRHGIQGDAFTFHVASNPPRDYCTQYAESDFEFIQRLCAEDGIAWHHQHSADGHLLVFTDDQVFLPTLTATPYLQESGLVAEHQVISRFRVRNSTRTSTVTRRDYDLKRPSLLLESRFTAGFTPVLEDYRYPLLIENERRGKQIARQALERHRSDYELGEGESDQTNFRCGHLFALTGHPRKQCNDLWLLLSVTHEGRQPQVLEETSTGNVEPADGFTQGYRNRFSVIPAEVVFRPALPPRRSLVTQTARVTGPKGEDIYCDEFGRVKIELPWDRKELDSERSSCWVRVASSWAGDHFGTVTIPRVGMEVVVSFLEGDPDKPLITGCVSNRVNAPPYLLPEHKTRTVLRSESSPRNGGYNELSIEDRAGQELIHVRAQRDMAQKIGNSLQLEVGNERRETISGNSYTRAGRSLDIEAGQQVLLKAGASVVLDAGASITLKAGGHHLVIDSGGIFSSTEIETGRKPQNSETSLLLPGLDGALPSAPAVHERAEEELEEEEEEVDLEDETPGGITLRIGVFFDGTGNNKANSETVAACYAPDANLAEAAAEIQQHCATYGYDGDGNSPDNSYGNDVSNIARLYELYTDDTYKLLPVSAKTASIAVYIEGVGTRSNDADSLYSQATGRGETGVVARVEQSPTFIRQQIQQLIERNPELVIQRIEFDIFGFSRGAAAARHFANEVLKGNEGILAKSLPSGLAEGFNWQPKVDTEINFIGVFDTVAAIANPWLFDFTGANSRNPGLELRLPDGCANKIVHLVARDEYRENFALNSLGDIDLVLPGAHSDLGGGYLPRAKEKLLLSNPLTSTISRDKDATRSAAYAAAEKEAYAWYAKGVIEEDAPGSQLRVALWERAVIQPTEKGGYRQDPQKRVYAAASIERPVHGELSLVYLRIMRELAVRANVPLKIIPETPTLKLPDELIPIHKKLQSYALGESAVEGLTIKERELLRSRYIHLSAHWNAAKDLNSSDMSIVFINRPARNNQRVVHPHE
ncbi:type VI secretion system tip protein TssI/VgrG [Pseudomonas sp.]|jgi:type VI secretion system secreted protein VgrG|uniref:type VI secretion system tip protein TssI/VgrG n=1 Tax=Pseudomonas sp. TaxID=306 RepID=UPI002E357930|nr:type VI secretion system tip protein TssI/VgrG [Pseudomonas sp.]HEX4548904.1 type VI secretion system tip protein TssI/VgrG [Pseudomonas sp.]